MLRTFEKIGRTFNSLKDERKVFSYFYYELPDGRARRGGTLKRWSYKPNRTQSSFKLGKVRGCQWCMAFNNPGFVKYVKKKGSMRFCVRHFISYANGYLRQWKRVRGRLVQVRDRLNHDVAKGCFTLKAR